MCWGERKEKRRERCVFWGVFGMGCERAGHNSWAMTRSTQQMGAASRLDAKRGGAPSVPRAVHDSCAPRKKKLQLDLSSFCFFSDRTPPRLPSRHQNNAHTKTKKKNTPSLSLSLLFLPLPQANTLTLFLTPLPRPPPPRRPTPGTHPRAGRGRTPGSCDRTCRMRERAGKRVGRCE